MSGLPYTVGDAVRLTCNVTDAGGVPDDPATITLDVTLPDGTTVTVPSGDLVHASAGAFLFDYPSTMAGQHTARYSTTLPDGLLVIEFDVAPSLDTTSPHRPVYATAADFRQVTGQEPPADVIRRLANASEYLDELLIGCWYDVDADEEPTDARIAAAFARAVCWQVAWEDLTGDPDGLGLVYPQMSIGSVSISRGSGGAGQTGTAWDRAAPRLVTALRTAVDGRGFPLFGKFPIVIG
ncbi:hypothetical protein [Frankia sp. AgB32]|uniref:hypothetical protein n=1 Tax=Frankia sp. AgB32 TaxID=631119 RepID=UPI00200D4A11|nr:hypothetical protein [Frankia sp. AgB32]MCK9896970.1 hypothetical protein [Frankia sp. AgB32]